MTDLAAGGATSDPYFAGILLARMVNEESGAAVIEPWRVEELPDVWLDAFRMLRTDLGPMRRNLQQFNQFVAAWRQRALSLRQ